MKVERGKRNKEGEGWMDGWMDGMDDRNKPTRASKVTSCLFQNRQVQEVMFNRCEVRICNLGSVSINGKGDRKGSNNRI
jgi:hypothetical protein